MNTTHRPQEADVANSELQDWTPTPFGSQVGKAEEAPQVEPYVYEGPAEMFSEPTGWCLNGAPHTWTQHPAGAGLPLRHDTDLVEKVAEHFDALKGDNRWLALPRVRITVEVLPDA